MKEMKENMNNLKTEIKDDLSTMCTKDDLSTMSTNIRAEMDDLKKMIQLLMDNQAKPKQEKKEEQ